MWRTCFLKPPQNRPSCPMTSVTSSFRDGEGCPETWGGGVEVPGLEVVNETSQKLMLGTNRVARVDRSHLHDDYIIGCFHPNLKNYGKHSLLIMSVAMQINIKQISKSHTTIRPCKN